MKLKIIILIFGLIGVFATSCNSKTSNSISESEFFTDSIYSKKLSEFRKHAIYLPKGFDKTKKYPIIYGTDGNSTMTDKKEALDSLIDNKIIKPLIFVASFSNTKIADSTSMKLGNGKSHNLTYRYFEYVKHEFLADNKYPHLEKRFENHLHYFSSELIPYIEKEFNQAIDKNDRYFYGVSNGAGFGLNLLNKEPDRIGTYICFSIYGGDIQSNPWHKSRTYPNLYLRYGNNEPAVLKEDAEFLKNKYSESNSFANIKNYRGGHNYLFWDAEFIKIISNILKADRTVYEMWNAYIKTNPEFQNDQLPDSDFFHNNKADANRLAKLVINGKKRASSGLYSWYRAANADLPKIGTKRIVTDFNGIAQAIIETKKIDTIPFNKISKNYAELDIGSPIQPLEKWKKAHWDFFANAMEQNGEKPTEDMLIVCEWFETIWTKKN